MASTDLRAAAQQALEALKGYRREMGDPLPCDAEQALEAALAEPVQEPVGQRGAMFRTHPAVELQRSVESAVRPACGVDPAAKAKTGPLTAETVQEQEPDSPERRCGGPGCDGTCCQPVQEPIGYLWPTGRHPEFRFTQQKRDGIDGTPVYAAPPQRKPLTDEEIQAAWDSVDMRHPRGNETRIAFARAVERAHGIKE